MTYADIYLIKNDPAFTNRVHGAICDVCHGIVQPESPTSDARQEFAKAALKNPASFASQVTHYVLVDYIALTTDAVLSAPDDGYKTAVASAIDKLIGLPDEGV